jgi:hypothetical protein
VTEPKHITPLAIPKCTKGAALSNQKKLRAHYRKFERDWFALGRAADKAIQRGEHTVLGFKTPEDWLADTFRASPQKLQRAIRSARALIGLPETKLSAMSEGNAYRLSRLPEKLRKSSEWVDAAASLPNADFQRDVEAELGRHSKEPAEKFRMWRLGLPEAVYAMMVTAEELAAKALELDLEAKPGLRIVVWERIAHVISETGPDNLRALLSGEN